MTVYTCADCGYSETFEDFAQGCCPACGCDDVHAHEQDSAPVVSYDLDQYLDLGETDFDLGE
jgi:hypothetical protein